jgi:hypothetical protein
VIPFIQETWFVWWILATLVVLRWFHLFSFRSDNERAFEAADSGEEKAATVRKAA